MTHTPCSEPKMGPWELDEIIHMIQLYNEQMQEYGDDHIDFQVCQNLRLIE